ncbi:MAG: hypothetical protein V4467_04590 [Patescibacteria group bacterium]
MKTIKRLVIKFGTGTLLNGGSFLDSAVFSRVADQVVRLKRQGVEVIIVTSAGVVAGGEELLRLGKNPNAISKKLRAAIGALRILTYWAEAFSNRGLIAQFWVTYRNWSDTGERRSIRDTALEALAAGITPVFNENDPVSDLEIQTMLAGISDNDWLAGKIAWLLNADAIMFFSDVEAVFERNPTQYADARAYLEIDPHNIPKELRAAGAASKTGRGGMGSKIMAAAKCAKQGMRVSIASLNGTECILRFVAGEHVGTMMGTKNILK